MRGFGQLLGFIFIVIPIMVWRWITYSPKEKIVLPNMRPSTSPPIPKAMEQALFRQSHYEAFIAGATAYAVACGHSPLFMDNEMLQKVRAEYEYKEPGEPQSQSASEYPNQPTYPYAPGDETPPCNDGQIGPKQPDPQ